MKIQSVNKDTSNKYFALKPNIFLTNLPFNLNENADNTISATSEFWMDV